MEQIIWAIIFIIFIIATILRNWSKKRPGTTIEREKDIRQSTKEERDKLSKYLEEMLGIEVPETKPQKRVEKEKPRPLKERITPRPEPKPEKKVGEFISPLVKRYEEEKKAFVPKKKDIYRAKFPWGTLSKKDLPNAIIFSEIIGPPIAKRKSHRLF